MNRLIMSNPRNPLNSYQTHQHHFLFLAANQTESIRNMVNNMKDGDYFNKLKAIEPGNKIEDNGIVCITNTNISTRIAIEDIIIESIPTNAEGPGTITAATDIKMVLKEPNGIYFLDYFRDLLEEELKTGYGGAVFILVPYFIGYHPNSSAFDVRPNRIFSMLLRNINATFSEEGGMYELTFVDVTNGAALLNGNFGYINKNINLVAKDDSLNSIITSLEDGLNKQISSYRDNLRKSNQLPDNYGRMVEYMITIPNTWKNYKIRNYNTDLLFNININKTNNTIQNQRNNSIDRDDSNDVNAVKESEKEKERNKQNDNYPNVEEAKIIDPNLNFDSNANQMNKKKTSTYINTQTNVSITEVINTILKNCVELKKRYSEAVENKKTMNEIKTHKVITNITSDSDRFIVHYDIVEVEPKPVELQNVNDNKQVVVDSVANTERLNQLQEEGFKNIYEFDFIFSGLNTDIISFDMNLVDASHYLYRLPIDNFDIVNKRQQGENPEIIQNPKPELQDKKKSEKANILYIREKDPIAIPKNYTGDFKTGNLTNIYTTSAIEKTDFYRVLSFMAGIDQGAQKCNLVINGNPELLGVCTMNIKPCDRQQYLSELRDDESKTNATGEDAKNNSLIRIPLLIKVNVYYPAFNGENKKFWYDGYYIVKKITNKFTNGMFIQELEMLTFTLDTPTAGNTSAQTIQRRLNVDYTKASDDNQIMNELSNNEESNNIIENNFIVNNVNNNQPKERPDWN